MVSPRLSVVVPTVNEAATIGPLIRRLREELADIGHEIVLVDDGSTDGTRRHARRADPDVRIIHRRGERGLGSAVKRGFQAARGELICVMDGDLQHPPDAVPKLVDTATWTEADVVVGSRFAATGETVGFPLHRQVMARAARLMARAASPKVRGWQLTDPCSGFFVVRAEALQLDQLSPRGYKILLDVLHHAPIDRVEEVGIRFGRRPEGESNLSSATVGAYLRQIAAIAADAEPNRRLAKFALVGLTGVLVNLALLAGLTELAGWHYLASATIAIEASIVSNFALNDAWTFRDRRYGPWWRRMVRFNLVSLLALAVNLGVLSLLTEGAGLHYVVAELVAIGVGFLANYQANLSWTYLPERSDIEDPERLPWQP